VSLDARLAHAVAIQRLRQRDLADLDVADSEILQVSMIEALLDGCYDGDVTVGDLKGRGNFGLGTLQGLDGELVVVDGEFWNIGYDGVARLAPDDTGVPFAAIVTFTEEKRFTLTGPIPRTELEDILVEHLDDPAGCSALRLNGTFGPVTFRSVARQEPPYRPLADVIATDERLFTRDELAGTMVGFHFPDSAAEMNQPGFHLHMVTNDRTTGGHVYDFTLLSAEVFLGQSHTIHVELPERNLAELLELDEVLRTVHRCLVRHGDASVAEVAAATGLDITDTAAALRRLANRGMADRLGGSTGDDPGAASYRAHLAWSRPATLPEALDGM
jgi:acetolactate decarboxylase